MICLAPPFAPSIFASHTLTTPLPAPRSAAEASLATPAAPLVVEGPAAPGTGDDVPPPELEFLTARDILQLPQWTG